MVLGFDAPPSLQLGWLPPILPAISLGLVQVNWIHAALENRRGGKGFHPKVDESLQSDSPFRSSL